MQRVDTFNPRPTDGKYDEAFPLVKYCRGSRTEKFLRLVGLDSNVNYPVWVVGMNASGRIDTKQMARLRDDVLRARSPARMTLVPIVVPELGNELQDYFLALNVSDGNELIKLCADQGVSGILHGHYHAFSRWSGLTPAQQQLAIVGSPAGTLTALRGAGNRISQRTRTSNQAVMSALTVSEDSIKLGVSANAR
jgi:hypothetical protein